jgi:YD repeat-containing protein
MLAALAAGLAAVVEQTGPTARVEHDAAGHVSSIATPDGAADFDVQVLPPLPRLPGIREHYT